MPRSAALAAVHCGVIREITAAPHGRGRARTHLRRQAREGSAWMSSFRKSFSLKSAMFCEEGRWGEGEASGAGGVECAGQRWGRGWMSRLPIQVQGQLAQ